MQALLLSEYYGFARLGFRPTDVTCFEDELKSKYCDPCMRVPEFVAGQAIVEVKRLHLNRHWDLHSIVSKACQKAHKQIVDRERVLIYHICYVLPMSMLHSDVHKIMRLVKEYTRECLNLVYVRELRIAFARAPDTCFVCE